MKKVSILLCAFCISLFANSIAGNTTGVVLNNSEVFKNVVKISSLSAASSLVAPVAIAGSGATYTQITANWNTSVDATHYHLDVSSSIGFTSFVTGYNNYDASNVTTCNVTGLTCGTTYYYRVRAENTCNTSINSNIITYAAAACWTCGNTFTVNHIASGNVAPVDKTVTYGTVTTSLSGESRCWITQNLGATNQATSATDNTEASAGWYWQFNRSRGYKHTGATSTTILTPAWTITLIGESSNWIAARDPCAIELGVGWRIPTTTEWFNADANGAWVGYNNTYSSVLVLHAAGYLDNNGTLDGRVSGGHYGYYWSSNQIDTYNSRRLAINTDYDTYVDNGGKSYGHSLRCIK